VEKPFCPQCEREFNPEFKVCPYDGAELIIRSEDILSGKMLDGRYRVLHKIGEGGMGAVYKAQQISTGKNVAIKVVSRHLMENPAIIRRFQREVKLQSKLEHPNIVTVIDFSQTQDGHYFFVMPFVEGKSLHRLILDDGKLSLNNFHDLASQICDGLEYAHRKGVIHRDIKGDNIAIANMEHQRVIKILDFGLAKAIQQDGSSKTGAELTQQGRVMGTPDYMSPEQAKGDTDKVGKPSDIYSLGVILYQMLSGKLPFESDTPWGVMNKHISEPPVPLRRENPEISQTLERVVLRCLEKEIDKRYPSALAVKRDLAKAAGDSTGAIYTLKGVRALSLQETAIQEDKPIRSRVGIFALVALLTLVAGGLWMVKSRRMADDKRISAATDKARKNQAVNEENKRKLAMEKRRKEQDAKREEETKRKAEAESTSKNTRLEKEKQTKNKEKRIHEQEAIQQLRLARRAAKDENIDLAEELVSKAEELAPDLDVVIRARARLEEVKIRWKRAKVRRLLKHAKEAARQGKPDQAGRYLDEAEDIAPNADVIREAKARLAERKKQTPVGKIITQPLH